MTRDSATGTSDDTAIYLAAPSKTLRIAVRCLSMGSASVGVIVWMMWQNIHLGPKAFEFILFSGFLIYAGLSAVVNSARGKYRLVIAEDRVTMHGVTKSTWAAWTGIGPFYYIKTGNVLAADLCGPDGSKDVIIIRKMTVPADDFQVDRMTLLSRLNTARERAVATSTATGHSSQS